MKRLLYFIFCFVICNRISAQLNSTETLALIKRVVPQQASQFEVQVLQSSDSDRFEIESRHDKIILRGNNGVAVASALYYYLTHYCHCQVTWNGTHLHLPKVLPRVPEKVVKETPYKDRYYLNYCTFNYSMSWWDWSRWQREIDWMAMHGINMPLAITGEEYTWYRVYKELGFTDADLANFFSGPAYFSWFWMGNLDGWDGPLPLSWMKSHHKLEKKIVQRERALGMKPVLPAFTGHVPSAFKKRFPGARLKATNWHNGFADTYILDAYDPLFKEIGNRFLNKQIAWFGTDHFYSADTFNENEPPTSDSSYLADLSKRVYEGMAAVDPKAVWVMQGWLFYSDRKFWKEPQIQALLNAIPDEHMLLLDLAAEIEPVWKRTRAFYGKPWIWNMLHNFGGNISLFGRMDGVASGPATALNKPEAGKLTGIGLTMEGIEQNPVLYELMMSHTWSNAPVELNNWLPFYIQNRYNGYDAEIGKAWEVLRRTVYNGLKIRDGAESIITGRPTFDSATVWTRTTLNYEPQALLPAWDIFVKSSRHYQTDGFLYDLVDLSRQVLVNYAMQLHHQLVAAYQEKDPGLFQQKCQAFLQLIDDVDRLLGTRKDFLLGSWLSDARRWGTTPAEKDLYEKNARDLITLWGDENSPLHEYSCRQWSGLLNGFYKRRWIQFFDQAVANLKKGEVFDTKLFDRSIRKWEWGWVNAHDNYPIHPSGDAVTVVKALYRKYRKEIETSYYK